MFLNIFKHLLPNARAWRLTVDKFLRQFFDGLSVPLGDDTKQFFDEVWTDVDPQQTRELGAWENQFALVDVNLTEQERRDRLDATWKAVGGQDPRYIQDTLQAAGFDVYVHEWWVPGTEPAIDSPAAATPRDPTLALTDGTPVYLNECGEPLAECGEPLAECGERNDPEGYLLVNKDGSTYNVPTTPAEWSYVLYIGAQTYPNVANVDANRKDEFEDLCLKICPAHQWLGIIVTFT